MRNKEVIENFVCGLIGTSGNGNLVSTGDKLFSYNTCIAQYNEDGEIIFNTVKYSTTTSCHQGMLKRTVNYPNKLILVSRIIKYNGDSIPIPIGTRDLKLCVN